MRTWIRSSGVVHLAAGCVALAVAVSPAPGADGSAERRPRLNLVRYHGVLVPAAAGRGYVVPAPPDSATVAGCSHGPPHGGGSGRFRGRLRWFDGLANVVQARLLLKTIPYAETRKEAERLKGKFQAWCKEKRFSEAARLIDKDLERMVAFYRFLKEHWKHLRTSNVEESPFASVRLRSEAAKRYKRVENVTAVIWRTLLTAERNFRRLDHPELLAEVAQGAKCVDGAVPGPRHRRNDATGHRRPAWSR